MRIHIHPALLASALLAACCAALAAQAPAPTDPAAAMGFSYSLPAGWTVAATKPPQPVAQTGPRQAAAIAAEKKGTACIEVTRTALHGSPSSVIVEVALPFGCFGQTMKDSDLQGFGQGAAEGLKQAFDLSAPVFGAYTLGSHRFWIERAKASAKGRAATAYTVEIACGLLKKGAVCWMAMAADAASLQAFEQAPVTLEGESAPALVPATTFDKAPSP